MKRQHNGAQSGWQIFRWPLLMALANTIGLVAALVGDGWYDLLSWLTLGLTLVVMVAAWRGWNAGTVVSIPGLVRKGLDGDDEPNLY